MNHFTKDEIKNSVEYKWRIYNRNFGLIMFSLINFISIIVLFFIVISKVDIISIKDELVKSLFIIGIVVEIIYAVCFLPVVLFHQWKSKYIIKEYQKFKAYEVVLNTPLISYWYRNAIYYEVTIKDETTSKIVNTNPYFSNMFFSKFDINEYNNKKVIGLYDEEKNKFYIVK